MYVVRDRKGKGSRIYTARQEVGQIRICHRSFLASTASAVVASGGVVCGRFPFVDSGDPMEERSSSLGPRLRVGVERPDSVFEVLSASSFRRASSSLSNLKQMVILSAWELGE